MIEHAVKAQLGDQRAAQAERQERLAKARERERKARQASGTGAFRTKKARPSASTISTEADAGDDEFLPEDKEENGETDGMYLSAEVKALMTK